MGVGGALFVAGRATPSVHAVARPGDTVASRAAGGVGYWPCACGGTAGAKRDRLGARHHPGGRHGVIGGYGDGVADASGGATGGVDAFIDARGG